MSGQDGSVADVDIELTTSDIPVVDDDSDEYSYDELIEEELEDLTNIRTTNDIITHVYFPKYQSDDILNTAVELPTGTDVTVLINVVNQGAVAYNISHVQGSLLSAYDPSFHIQNFSLLPLNNAIIGMYIVYQALYILCIHPSILMTMLMSIVFNVLYQCRSIICF